MSDKKFLPIAYHQWKWKKFKKANISIATHALHYWVGAYGGMRAIPDPSNPKKFLLFRLTDHASRLAMSAKFLWYDLTAKKIAKTITKFIERNAPKSPIYIRPLIYTSDLDFSPRIHDIEKDFLIYGVEFGDYLDPSGISCTISSWQRQVDTNFPLRGKITGAYITSALAKTEAVNRWFDDAILMNAQWKVSEWSAMNIFIVRNGIIRTPAITEDILEGITRDSVIQIARSMGYTVIEWQIDKSELFIADEVFFTGTAARITPVKQIEQYMLSTDHPITDRLKARFDTIVQGRDDEFAHWITRV